LFSANTCPCHLCFVSVFITKGAKHSGKIYAGYADITFFNEKDRWKAKEAGVTG
jgi:hypothetical protein